MAQASGKSFGEFLQIAILAAFFTAAGFALVTAILVFFVNPKKADQADMEARRYERLTEALSDRELTVLRATAKQSEGEDSDKPLTDIIHEKLTGYGLEFTRFPRPTEKDNSVRQQVTLKAAPLAPILQFVAAIAGAKKNLHVLDFKVKPATRTRGATDEDSWVATVEFIDFATTG